MITFQGARMCSISRVLYLITRKSVFFSDTCGSVLNFNELCDLNFIAGECTEWVCVCFEKKVSKVVHV